MKWLTLIALLLLPSIAPAGPLQVIGGEKDAELVVVRANDFAGNNAVGWNNQSLNAQRLSDKEMVFVMPKLAVGDYPVQVTIGGAFPLGCLGSALLRKAADRAHKGPEPRFNGSGANACAPERR